MPDSAPGPAQASLRALSALRTRRGEPGTLCPGRGVLATDASMSAPRQCDRNVAGLTRAGAGRHVY